MTMRTALGGQSMCKQFCYVLCQSVLFIWLQFPTNLSATEHACFVSTINIKSFFNWPVKMCFHFIIYCAALALELKYLSPQDLLILSERKQAVYWPPLLYFILNNLFTKCQDFYLVSLTKLMPICTQTYWCGCLSVIIYLILSLQFSVTT